MFGPYYDDPLKIKDRWYKLIMKICHVIWKTYQDLGTECFNCPPESTGRRCWRCKEKEEKIKKEKKAEEMKNWQQRETSPVMKENENYIRKRKPIDFTVEDLENEAEIDNDEEFEASKKVGKHD